MNKELNEQMNSWMEQLDVTVGCNSWMEQLDGTVGWKNN